MRIGTLFARSMAVFAELWANMRENMQENVLGRNFSVGHRDFFEPPPLPAPPNSPHSWLAPLTPRLGGRCPPNPTARCGQHYAPTAHLRPKSRFCRLRAGPEDAATPSGGGRSGLPTPAHGHGHPRPAWAVWSHARPAWFTKLDLRRARPGISGPGAGPKPHFAAISSFSPRDVIGRTVRACSNCTGLHKIFCGGNARHCKNLSFTTETRPLHNHTSSIGNVNLSNVRL